MKNLKTFENYDFDLYQSNVIKQYGDSFPLTKLAKGDKVFYFGNLYIIDEVNEYFMLLMPIGGGKSISVNQKMFNDKGFIPRENKPKNYNE
jgi:hypothetical protein